MRNCWEYDLLGLALAVYGLSNWLNREEPPRIPQIPQIAMPVVSSDSEEPPIELSVAPSPRDIDAINQGFARRVDDNLAGVLCDQKELDSALCPPEK